MSTQDNHPVLPKDFYDRSPIERRQFLENAADRIDQSDRVQRALSDEEIEELRFRLQRQSIELKDLQEEYDELKSAYREQINDQKASRDQIVSKLKRGIEEVSGTTMTFFDQENGRAYKFLPDGTQVDDRPLMPSERQTSLQGQMRKVESGDE